jgi:O-antigen ligase
MWILIVACLLPALLLSWQQLRAPGERFVTDVEGIATLNKRLPVWKTGASIVPSYAAIGVGWGTFESGFQMVQPSSRVRWRHAHNDWLQSAIEGGVAAPVLAALILWLAWTAAQRNGGPPNPLRKCIVAGTAALAFHCVLDFPLRVPAIGVLAACFLGLLCAREIFDRDVRPLTRDA